mmetsp:Transcript_892/g.1492  ORF Transcript_892/g.1492 Transcript_892/m.1492 type:complete len:206 (+) Transcript_892:41-658(+)
MFFINNVNIINHRKNQKITNLDKPCKGITHRKSNALATIKCDYNYNIFLDGKNRAKRSVTNQDRYAIVQKPLGLVLEEEEDGMVVIANVDPKGNSAQSGFDIRVGDVVVAVSATFGDEVWSTRGVGLDRVLKSIKIRSGDFVTIVLESKDENQDSKDEASENASKRRDDAREKFGAPVILDPITLTPMKPESGKKPKLFGLFETD